MKKIILILITVFAITASGYSQIIINGKQWKPKSKEEKEAEKKKKENEEAKAAEKKVTEDKKQQELLEAEEKKKQEQQKQEEIQKKYPPSEISRITDLEMYPSHSDDVKSISNHVEAFYYGYSDSIQTKLKHLKEYPGAIATLEKVRSTYKEYLEMCDATKKNYRFFGDNDVDYKKLVSYINSFKNEMENDYNNALDIAKRKEQALKTKVDYELSKTELGSDYQKTYSYLKVINYYMELAKFLKGEASADYKELQLISQRSEELVKKLKEHEKMLVDKQNEEKSREHEEAHERSDKAQAEENLIKAKENFKDDLERAKTRECPKDYYSGSDKQTLKNIVINYYKNTDYKLLKVYVTGDNWDRQTKWLNGSDGSYTKSDVSQLPIAIIYQTNDPEEIKHKVANLMTTYLVKDHTNGGKITVGAGYYQASSDGLIYLSNIK